MKIMKATGKLGSEQTADITRPSILFVDDYRPLLDTIESAFSSVFDVIVSDDAIACEDLACLHQPDLIVLDFDIGKRNGLELCKTLKSNPEIQDIPIVFYTSFPLEALTVPAKQAGALKLISKSVSLNGLFTQIKACCEIED